VPAALSDLDREVRLCVYRRFLAEGRPPEYEQVAEELDVPVGEAEAAFRSLEAGNVLVFAPGTLNIWMANPLSSVPTDFWVETPRGGYWGSCVWDAFGVIAMLGGEGTISTSCPDCNESMEFRVEQSQLVEAEEVAHFAVPARRWWDNIGFT
jgi:Alkylmercury lyase